MTTVSPMTNLMPSYRTEPGAYGTGRTSYSSYRANYSTLPQSTYGKTSSVRSSSHLLTKPPSGYRPLPSGPGPLDRYGKRQNTDDVRSILHNNATRSTSSVSRKPIKADYSTSYDRSYVTDRTSDRTQSKTSPLTGLRRDTLSPSSTLRHRTSSNQDLHRNLHNLDITDTGSLRRSSHHGSLSNISVSNRRPSFERKDSDSHSPMYSSKYRNKNASSNNPPSESSFHSEREKSPKERITATLTPEKKSPLSRVKAPYSESDEDTSSPSYTTSPDNNNNRITSDYKHCGKTGLANLGNTCFMNCVLQCLSNTRPLVEFCLSDSYKTEINKKTSSMKGALISAYVSLMKNMWDNRSSVSPTEFKSQIQRFAPRFVGYSQQDAQEFLRYLLQGLHEDINRVQSKPNPAPVNEKEENSLSDEEKASRSWKRYLNFDSSVIVDIFVGQLKSTLTCTECHQQSVTFDPFWDLSLPIPKRSIAPTLLDCLSLFMQEEVLDGDERPRCDRCREHRRCTKSFRIQKFPRVLVLHLKRFSGERYRSKLSTQVDYPVTGLSLAEFAASRGGSKATYNLYGVSNHSGSVYSGHYTAYCKHPYTGVWMSCNDSHVRDVTNRGIVSSEGYVLFYERVGESQL